MAGKLYYLEWRGSRAGPYNSAELKRLAAAGTIPPAAMIRRVGANQAVSADKVSGLYRTIELDSESQDDTDNALQ